jgi:chromosome segregation ATPase
MEATGRYRAVEEQIASATQRLGLLKAEHAEVAAALEAAKPQLERAATVERQVADLQARRTTLTAEVAAFTARCQALASDEAAAVARLEQAMQAWQAAEAAAHARLAKAEEDYRAFIGRVTAAER